MRIMLAFICALCVCGASELSYANTRVLESQDQLSAFESMALIPLSGASSGAIETSYDPFRGVATLTSTQPFNKAWLNDLPGQFGYQLHVAELVQVDPQTLRFRLQSMASTLVVIDSGTPNAKLVFGKQRPHMVVLPAHFFGAECPSALPYTSNRDIRRVVNAFCEGDFRPLHDFAGGVSERPASEQHLVTLLYTVSNPWDMESGALRRYTRRHALSADLRVSAMLIRAMHHALRDELPTALDVLDEVRTGKASLVNATDRRWQRMVDRFGEALFERLMLAALTHGSASELLVISYYEDYRQWETPAFPIAIKQSIAESYRKAHLYQRATQLYLELLARQGDHNIMLLEELAHTYLEAGDHFRSYETLRFLMERHPTHRLPDELKAVLSPAFVNERPVACPDGTFTIISGSYGPLAELGCSLKRDDKDRALEHAKELQSGNHDATFQQIGRWWEESMQWQPPQLGTTR